MITIHELRDLPAPRLRVEVIKPAKPNVCPQCMGVVDYVSHIFYKCRDCGFWRRWTPEAGA